MARHHQAPEHLPDTQASGDPNRQEIVGIWAPSLRGGMSSSSQLVGLARALREADLARADRATFDLMGAQLI